jgi:hypothetical protein
VVEETVRGKGDGYDWYKGALERYGKFPDAVAAWKALKRRAYYNRRLDAWVVLVRSQAGSRKYRGGQQIGKHQYRQGFQVYLHRLVKAYEVGRMLEDAEVVHHLDGNRSNNHPTNLRLLESQEEHLEEHGGRGWCVSRNQTVYAWDRELRKIRPLARIVAERFFKRRLRKGEVVIHLNGDGLDNRPSNLQVVSKAENLRRNRGTYAKAQKERSRDCGGEREAQSDRLRDGRAAGSVAGGADAHGAAHGDRTRRRAA